jgi:hypothetical protein
MPTNADGMMGHAQNADLFYLAGVRQEETILLLAPDAFEPKLREVLFMRESNEQLATWEGPQADQGAGRADFRHPKCPLAVRVPDGFPPAHVGAGKCFPES